MGRAAKKGRRHGTVCQMPTGSYDPFGAQLARSHEFGGAAGLSLFFSELDASLWISDSRLQSLLVEALALAKPELFLCLLREHWPKLQHVLRTDTAGRLAEYVSTVHRSAPSVPDTSVLLPQSLQRARLT